MPPFCRRGGWSELLIARQNPDIFRFHLEVSLLLLAFALLPRLWRPAVRAWFGRVFFLIYVLALLYAVYETVTRYLYHTEPVLFNDYRFLIGGIGLLVDALQLSPWALALGAGLAVGSLLLLYKLILRWFLHVRVQDLGRASRIVAWGLGALLVVFALAETGLLARSEAEVNSLAAKLAANTRASLQARQEISAYDRIEPEAIYHYADTTRLLQRPNIYLIFVESYGSVLYKRAHFEEAYRELMQGMQARLEEEGWASVTALSTSPTWGGGSWMAYTSVEFGLRIASQPQFLAVRDRYAREPYPSLGRYLQSQGYRYVRLSPIQRRMDEEDARLNHALYGPDRWLKFPDLDYVGPLYGWGPSPPDQYSLHKARELLGDEAAQPLFLVYLTQNSHYPWAPLPELKADWRALNDPDTPSPPPIGEPIPHRDNIKHYREAIRYQWAMLSAFILSTPPDENAIFVLVGDHQPPRVSRRADGFETPIHIIARDEAFLNRFQTYGFEPGLLVSDLTADLRHEGLYSMFIRELAGTYGVSQSPLPYLPQGIALDISVPETEGEAPASHTTHMSTPTPKEIAP
jgi:hypothetical protein